MLTKNIVFSINLKEGLKNYLKIRKSFYLRVKYCLTTSQQLVMVLNKNLIKRLIIINAKVKQNFIFQFFVELQNKCLKIFEHLL